jgi:endoglucanase
VKISRLVLLLLTLPVLPVSAQEIAQRRAGQMGMGANLSFLENYWNGTKALHYADYLKLSDVPKRRDSFRSMAALGFRTVRIPVCFSAWASLDPPYRWEKPGYFAAVDSLLSWAGAAGLLAILDLHHPELDGSFPTANTVERKAWIWREVASRYRNTNPDRVFFELQNEPYNIKAAEWRQQAVALAGAVRTAAPNHTLIVGAEDWNGIDALTRFQPLSDSNVIYTFHFYDPMVFTHQGAEWVQGLESVQGVPFPVPSGWRPNVPASARGTWVESALNSYAQDGTTAQVFRRTERARQWADSYRVPVFLGEFGSYNRFADADSRCRYFEAVVRATGQFGVPFTFWEWDGGFTLFAKGTTDVMPCMKAALASYANPATGLEPTAQFLQLSPNPTRASVRLDGAPFPPRRVEVLDLCGHVHLTQQGDDVREISLEALPPGLYLLKIYSERGPVVVRKILRQ